MDIKKEKKLVAVAELPALPRVLKKKEADVTPHIMKWFREKHRKTAVFEIKATDTNSIPQSALAEHQRAALVLASRGTLAHKLTDASRTRQPFDGFCVSNVPAYVVAAFTEKRKAYVIPVERWRGASIHMVSVDAFLYTITW